MNSPAPPNPLAAALRRALLLLGLSTAVCGSALWLEWSSGRDRAQIASALSAAQARLATARAIRETRATHGARYASLRRRGIIGADPRLALMDTLQSRVRELRLRTVAFELQPATAVGELSINRMNLRVGVVHEAELLRLLDRLRAHAPAVLWARRCSLEQPGGEAHLRRDADNLSAGCELEWLTVRPLP